MAEVEELARAIDESHKSKIYEKMQVDAAREEFFDSLNAKVEMLLGRVSAMEAHGPSATIPEVAVTPQRLRKMGKMGQCLGPPPQDRRFQCQRRGHCGSRRASLEVCR